MYSSYTRRKVGLCRIGKRGAHSWKKTLTHLSENIRGGAVVVFGVETSESDVVSPSILRKASVLKPESDLPLSCILRLKASDRS